MTFEEITKIIGLPLNAPEVVEFIKNNGYIILINILLTSYYYYTYHPLSYIQKYIL